MIEQDRLKQKLRVLQQHELPFIKVLIDAFKLKGDEQDDEYYISIIYELKNKYLKELRKLKDEETLKFKQQKLF